MIIDLLALVQSWVSDQTGETTIFAEQDGPRPVLPYNTVRVQDQTVPGLANIRLSDSDQDRHTLETMTTIEITAYGASAIQTIINLKLSLELQSVRDFFRGGNYPIANVESIVNLSRVVDVAFEPRSILTINFHGTQELTDDLGKIETVVLNGTEV